MSITHTFAGSRAGHDYGYYAFIENGELVIGDDWPHEGGTLYRGTYFGASRIMKTLERENVRLFNSINKYYTTHPEHAGVRTLGNLIPGMKFKRKDDETTYMLVDMDVSKCFVFGDKLQGFVVALDLSTFKVMLFDKMSEVELVNET